MFLVDHALAWAAEQGKPIRLGLVGAGYSGGLVAHHILRDVPGIFLSAIANRTPERAQAVFRSEGIGDVPVVEGRGRLDRILEGKGRVVTPDVEALCASGHIDVVMDATGAIEFGAGLSLMAIRHGKHMVTMNVELDSTAGPLLARLARQAGVVYSNIDGDEPAVAMNLIRTVRGMGLEPIAAGNLKGLYDPYRTPATQEDFARAHGQDPATMTHFADGTKLCMELTLLANATGFRVGKRGCYGPALSSVREAPEYYRERLQDGGMVDYIVGAEPKNGVFVLAKTTSEKKRDYLEYFKMGPGPIYCLNTPYHLPHLEFSNTIARAALFGDAAIAPMGAPVCETVAVAKKDLREGEVLDGIGGFCAYGLIENSSVAEKERLLPMGVSDGCRLKRPVSRDAAISYDDVDLPPGRTIDRLREMQREAFGGMRL